MKVFVISLESSVSRREAIIARLSSLGIEAEVFTAIDGRKLSVRDSGYNGRLRRLLYGKNLTPGEIGCALSHLSVCDEIARRGIERALILEDDARVQDNLPDVLRMLESCPDKWDLIRFIGSPKNIKRMRVSDHMQDGLTLNRIYGTPGGAYGYVVNLRAAKKLASKRNSIWMPVDILHGQVWWHRLRVRCVLPEAILPDMDVESTIGCTRFGKTLEVAGWERAAFPFTRFIFKLFDTAAKQVTYRLGI